MKIEGKKLDSFMKCIAPNCSCLIDHVEIFGKEDAKLVMQTTCTAGHINEYMFDMTAKRLAPFPQTKKAEPPVEKTDHVSDVLVRGVHHYNGKTSRQTLLTYVKQGDPLEIEKGSFKKDGRDLPCYFLRHALGIIGTVSKKDIEQLDTHDGTQRPIAKVSKILKQRKDDETSYGCVVDLYVEPSSEPIVYLIPDGYKIYHLNPTCSGLQGARAVALYIAEQQGYRPCKRCAEGKITEKEK